MSTPHYTDDMVTLHLGDCREVLAGMPDASVEAVVTDPPYEISFMSRSWDGSGIAFDPIVWRECLRVLKPGGHLLAFGGTRTYHRLAVAIEDAGFEIRDSIHWLYGGGMPKSGDIGKAIDRRRDDRSEVLRVTAFLAGARDAAGWTTRMLNDAFGHAGDRCSHWTTQGVAASVPGPDQWAKLRTLLAFDDPEIEALVGLLNGRKGLLGEAWTEREVVGQGHRIRRESDVQIAGLSEGSYDITAPASAAAHRWHGWSGSLKPAHEPIVLARKSTGFHSMVANVLLHGTGALNIDGCRVPASEPIAAHHGTGNPRTAMGSGWHDNYRPGDAGQITQTAGRWPTNLVFSHSQGCVEDGPCQPDCLVLELDRQSGATSSGRPSPNGRYGQHTQNGRNEVYGAGLNSATPNRAPIGDSGGASRYFPTFRYEAKAPASERPKLADGTAHATVKPLDLMRWLVRLVTPPGGVVLDPFGGSGTTGEAALIEGFRSILIELDLQHAELIKKRLSKNIQPVVLFDEIAP